MIVLAFALTTNAQSKFIDNLTKKVDGQGIVTITQDKRLTEIINGERQLTAPSKDDKAQQTDNKIKEEEKDTLITTAPTGKRTKVRGFRIQIYWGGSQRIDQTRAQQAADRVAVLFPEYQTYTSFESPHWRCRVGDFTDRKDAWEALKRLRDAGVASDAMIVRSEIYVYK
ncbi:MAG: SPOR domain-containing protein [Bacteroidaceae bacterium]|nr:SPOR domain-containing protein [Bacteroidaceae bacterium]